MFSETRYALNGELRVAYRASPPGARDIVFVPNWFTCCEILPELPQLLHRAEGYRWPAEVEHPRDGGLALPVARYSAS